MAIFAVCGAALPRRKGRRTGYEWRGMWRAGDEFLTARLLPMQHFNAFGSARGECAGQAGNDRMSQALLGHAASDIGGMVGQWLGANAPERLAGLALCCTGAKLGNREDFLARAELVRREGTGVTVDGARERWFTPAFRDAPEARRVLEQLAAIPAEGYAACAEAVGEWDFRDQLHRVAPGALVLFGDHDPVTPAEVRETLLRGIPDARAAYVRGAAHLANVEQPRAFSEAVLAHVEGVAA